MSEFLKLFSPNLVGVSPETMNRSVSIGSTVINSEAGLSAAGHDHPMVNINVSH